MRLQKMWTMLQHGWGKKNKSSYSKCVLPVNWAYFSSQSFVQEPLFFFELIILFTCLLNCKHHPWRFINDIQMSLYNMKHWHVLSLSLHFVRHEGRLATHPRSPASKSRSKLPIHVFYSACLGPVPGQIDSPYLINNTQGWMLYCFAVIYFLTLSSLRNGASHDYLRAHKGSRCISRPLIQDSSVRVLFSRYKGNLT